jgi:nucleoside 2-deoxyribosyltransferase
MSTVSDEVPASDQVLTGTAFFMSPSSNAGHRRRADSLCKEVRATLKENWPELNLNDWRDDSAPGLITVSIVRFIAEAPVVFADLTGQNANVYYEVGLAHALGVPVVAFLKENEALAFDLAPERAIKVEVKDNEDISDPGGIRTEIHRAVRAVEHAGALPTTAVAIYQQGLENLRLSSENETLRRGHAEPGTTTGILSPSDSADPHRWRASATLGRLRRVRVEELQSGLQIVDIEHGLGEVIRFQTLHGSRCLTMQFADGAMDSMIVPIDQLELSYFVPPV